MSARWLLRLLGVTRRIEGYDRTADRADRAVDDLDAQRAHWERLRRLLETEARVIRHETEQPGC